MLKHWLDTFLEDFAEEVRDGRQRPLTDEEHAILKYFADDIQEKLDVGLLSIDARLVER